MTETDHRSSTSQIVSGLKWSYLGAALRLVAQLGVAAVLARLLGPAEFGLVALGLLVIRFARYFADMGLVGAIVQAQHMDERQVGAALALSTGLGVAFCIVTLIASQPLADFYNMPALASVLAWLSLSFVASGLSIPSQGLLRRRLDFKFLSIADIVSYLIGYGVIGILTAQEGWGVYALVAASLTQSAVSLCLLYARVRHTLLIPVDRVPYEGILRYGSSYSLVNFLTFIASNLDQLIIGKFFTALDLGIYNRAKYLVVTPTHQMLASLTQVLFPSYAASQNDPRRLRTLYMNGMLLLGLLILPTSVGMIAAAETIVAVLLGPNWGASVPIMKICALYVPLEMLTSVGATLCSASGRLRMQAQVQVLTLGLLTAGILAVRGGSIVDVTMVIAAVYAMRFILYTLIVQRIIGTSVWDHLRLHASHCAAAALVFVSIQAATHGFGRLEPALMLPLQMAVGLLTLFVFICFSPFRDVQVAVAQLLRRTTKETSSGRIATFVARLERRI